jgi:predicted ATPase
MAARRGAPPPYHQPVDVLERDSVLGSLDDELSESLAGHGRTVLVTGEAGIGKSTVVRAFLGAHGDVRSAVGHCDPVAAPRSLGPILDLAAALGLPKLYSCGDSIDRSASRPDVKTFHEAMVAKPTIAVVEDAHWADDATLDALVHLARRIDQHPVLLILTFRPDEVGPEHPLRLMIGRLASLRLRRLGPTPESIRTAAESNGLPVDSIVEVSVLDPYFYHPAN